MGIHKPLWRFNKASQEGIQYNKTDRCVPWLIPLTVEENVMAGSYFWVKIPLWRKCEKHNCFVLHFKVQRYKRRVKLIEHSIRKNSCEHDVAGTTAKPVQFIYIFWDIDTYIYIHMDTCIYQVYTMVFFYPKKKFCSMVQCGAVWKTVTMAQWWSQSYSWLYYISDN